MKIGANGEQYDLGSEMTAEWTLSESKILVPDSIYDYFYYALLQNVDSYQLKDWTAVNCDDEMPVVSLFVGYLWLEFHPSDYMTVI